MSCLMYLDFEQVLPHGVVSQPVKTQMGGGGGDPRSR